MSDDRLEILVRSCAERAWRLAKGLVAADADADDLVQQALLVVSRKRAEIPDDGGWPWLARIIVLESRNLRRGRQLVSIGGHDVNSPDGAGRDPQALAAEAELMAGMRRALEELEPSQREAVVLTHVTGLSIRQASAAAELPPSTFADRLDRAMEVLRRRLGVDREATVGLLAVLPFVPPPGGLEAATTGWLASINGGGSATTAATILGGAVIMKKVLFAVIVIVVGVVSYLGFDVLQSEEAPVIERAQEESRVVEDGFVPTRTAADVGALEQQVGGGEGATTALPELGRVRGTLRDEDGRPVRGQVDAIDPSDRLIASGAPCDEAGRFELVLRAPTGSKHLVFVLRSVAQGMVGSKSVAMFLEPGAVLEDIELLVFEPKAIEGTVVDAVSGAPLPGFRVEPIAHPPSHERLREYVAVDGVSTDRQGRFELPFVPKSWNRVRVLHPHGDGWVVPIQVRGGKDRGGNQLMDLFKGRAEVEEPLTIRAHTEAVRFRVASPRPDWLRVEVMMADSERFEVGVHRIGVGDGEMWLPGMRSDFRKLRFSAPGWGEVIRDVAFETGEDIDLGTLTFGSQGTEMSGHVRAKDGQLLAEANVGAQTADGRFFTTMTKADGSYRLPGVPSGEVTMWIGHADHGTLSEKVVIGRTPLTQDWVLGGGPVIGGVVTLAGRAPTLLERGADGRDNRVRVFITQAQAVRIPVTPHAVRNIPGLRMEAGADGRFESVGLEAGEYVVAALYDGRVAFEVVVVDEDPVSVTLDISAGGRVEGVVREAAGEGRAGVRLRLSRYASRNHADDLSRRSDERGAFRFESVAPGEWYLKKDGENILLGNELEERRVVVRSGETSNIVLEVGASGGPGVSGRVLVEGKSVFKQALLIEPGQLMPLHRAAVDLDGEFMIEKVAAGSYYLWFVDSIPRPDIAHRMVVEVTAEEDSLRLDENLAGTTISGHVPGASEGLVTLRPALEDVLGNDPASRFAVLTAVIQQDGTFVFDGLAAGAYRVAARIPGLEVEPVVVDAEGDCRLELGRGTDGGELIVAIKSLRGFPALGPALAGDPMESMAILELIDPEGASTAVDDSNRMLSLRTGSSVTLRGVPEGAYTLQIRGRTIEPHRAPVRIVAGEKTRADVDLQRAAELHLLIENEEVQLEGLGRVRVTATERSGRKAEGLTAAHSALLDRFSRARGIVRVGPLEAGTWTMTVEVVGYRTIEFDVTILRGELVEERLRLER